MIIHVLNFGHWDLEFIWLLVLDYWDLILNAIKHYDHDQIWRISKLNNKLLLSLNTKVL